MDATDAALRDAFAIERLLAEYCHRVDDGDFDGAAALFTRDGTFVFGRQVVTGPQDVAGWLRTMQSPDRRGKHVTANVVVVDVVGDWAVVSSDFIVGRQLLGLPRA